LSNAAGLICLAMTLLLLPAGVRIVRADDEAEGRASVTPTPTASEDATPQKPVVAPVIEIDEAKEALRRGSAGTEGEPGVIVLNTRGFNYGPPPARPGPATDDRESTTP
jgi:hypothetical protein